MRFRCLLSSEIVSEWRVVNVDHQRLTSQHLVIGLCIGGIQSGGRVQLTAGLLRHGTAHNSLTTTRRAGHGARRCLPPMEGTPSHGAITRSPSRQSACHSHDGTACNASHFSCVFPSVVAETIAATDSPRPDLLLINVRNRTIITSLMPSKNWK